MYLLGATEALQWLTGGQCRSARVMSPGRAGLCFLDALVQGLDRVTRQDGDSSWASTGPHPSRGGQVDVQPVTFTPQRGPLRLRATRGRPGAARVGVEDPATEAVVDGLASTGAEAGHGERSTGRSESSSSRLRECQAFERRPKPPTRRARRERTRCPRCATSRALQGRSEVRGHGTPESSIDERIVPLPRPRRDLHAVTLLNGAIPVRSPGGADRHAHQGARLTRASRRRGLVRRCASAATSQ